MVVLGTFPKLPSELTERAFDADGKLAWRLNDLPPVLNAITEMGHAVITGELWSVDGSKRNEILPGVSSLPAWTVSARKPDEVWTDFCERCRKEALESVEYLMSDEAVTTEVADVTRVHPVAVVTSDVRSLIPLDKHDHERAEAAIAAGYPTVEPILPQLLEWIQDMNWPVAQTLQPFLASIGLPLVPHLREILATDDDVWKYWIINRVLEYSQPLAQAFRPELARIANEPTEGELEEELPEHAVRVLRKWLLEESR